MTITDFHLLSSKFFAEQSKNFKEITGKASLF